MGPKNRAHASKNELLFQNSLVLPTALLILDESGERNLLRSVSTTDILDLKLLLDKLVLSIVLSFRLELDLAGNKKKHFLYFSLEMRKMENYVFSPSGNIFYSLDTFVASIGRGSDVRRCWVDHSSAAEFTTMCPTMLPPWYHHGTMVLEILIIISVMADRPVRPVWPTRNALYFIFQIDAFNSKVSRGRGVNSAFH